MAATSYPPADFDSLLGSNPFSAKKTEIETLINQLRERLTQTRPKAYAGIDDGAVQDYMSYSVGAQRKLLDDYVKAAAGAGVKRGGFGVMGGPRLDSTLMYAALQNLAKDYPTRLKQALKYGSDIGDSRRKQREADMLSLQKLLSVQKGYLSEEADWREKLAHSILRDREQQAALRSQDQSAKLHAVANSAKYTAEQTKAENELQKLQREISQKLKDEADWNRLMRKASLLEAVGQFGAGWTSADDYNLKRLRGG